MCERTKTLMKKAEEADRKLTATINYFKKLIEELEGTDGRKEDSPPADDTEEITGNPT